MSHWNSRWKACRSHRRESRCNCPLSRTRTQVLTIISKTKRLPWLGANDRFMFPRTKRTLTISRTFINRNRLLIAQIKWPMKTKWNLLQSSQTQMLPSLQGTPSTMTVATCMMISIRWLHSKSGWPIRRRDPSLMEHTIEVKMLSCNYCLLQLRLSTPTRNLPSK